MLAFAKGVYEEEGVLRDMGRAWRNLGILARFSVVLKVAAPRWVLRIFVAVGGLKLDFKPPKRQFFCRKS